MKLNAWCQLIAIILIIDCKMLREGSNNTEQNKTCNKMCNSLRGHKELLVMSEQWEAFLK